MSNLRLQYRLDEKGTGLEGQADGRAFWIGGFHFQTGKTGVNALKWGLEVRDEGNELELQLRLTNPGAEQMTLSEAGFTYKIEDPFADVPGVPPELLTHDADNYCVCTGFEREGRVTLLAPVFRPYIVPRTRSQFALITELPSDVESRCFRVDLCMTGAIGEMADNGFSPNCPVRPIRLEAGEERSIFFSLSVCDDMDSAHNILRTRGMMLNGMRSGVNASIAPRTDWFIHAQCAATAQLRANAAFSARFEGGLLKSLRPNERSFEFIDPKDGFGHVQLTLDGEHTLDTRAIWRHC